MELYESLFIIRPSVSDEETNALDREDEKRSR